ncbi:cytochrome P450 [Lojkania enalia]|uniref:Cytochrome P450 n=1 Tax=Lojkania enalia TaxID=147567 RepID=A0A9P4N0P0_9PLEO|nr:cytochrome P450 [Didymosphaeria enalia]
MHSIISGVAAVLAGLLGLYFVLRQLLLLTQDAREPPAIATTIPFITPIIGMARFKSKYTVQLRDKHHLPIYTLRYPFQRMYIINSPTLISAVQRQTKALTFQAIEDKFSILITDPSQHAKAIFLKETEQWANSAPGHQSPSHILYKGLTPGPGMDSMNRAMVNRLETAVEGLASALSGSGAKKTMKLFAWVKHEITMATTEGVYGPQNPYRDPEIQDAFWAYEAGLGKLSLGVVPSLLAREAVRGREKVASAFEEYFAAEGTSSSSSLTKGRHEYYAARGYLPRDISKFECGNGIAILSNTVPTAYWMLFHLFSNPSALEACRAEIQAHITTTAHSGNGAGVTKALDISALKTRCPLLLSAFKEAMRLHAIGVGLRMVMTDTMLSNRYLLRKGALVVMPAIVQHHDANIWGPDVSSYDVARFTTTTTTSSSASSSSSSSFSSSSPPAAAATSQQQRKINPVSFRGFGGGATLCPGRHFATTEVLVFVSMLMLRFTVEAVGGWERPSTEKAPMSAVVPGPDSDFEVVIKRRADDEGVQWVWSLSGSDEGIRVTAEDMEGK